MSGDKGQNEGADGGSTPKAKLTFDLLGGYEGATQRKWVDAKAKLTFDLLGGYESATQRKWVDANPFEGLKGEDNASNFLRKAPEVLEGSWIFQRKKKHKVKIELTRPEAGHQPQLATLLSKTLGKREVRNTPNFTTLFLTL
jgi:hypothetical protein